MFNSVTVRPFRLILLVSLFSTAASGDVLVSYESDIDDDPTTPGVFDIDVGQTATIAISLSALGGETGVCTAGFSFAGTLIGEVVENGPITLSNFMWNDSFQDPGQWFTNNHLPDPSFVSFFCFGGNIPLTLATMNVTGDTAGTIIQDTSPLHFTDAGVQPLTIAPGSESFTVNVIPEPATALLLVVASAFFARRRTVN